MPVAHPHELTEDSLDRVFDRCAVQASVGETAGGVVDGVGD